MRRLLVIVPVLVVLTMLVASSESVQTSIHDELHTGDLHGELHVLAGPLAERSEATVVALGDRRVFVWGGRGPVFDDGAIYDPVTDTWELLPDAPGPGRYAAAGVWTGTEVVIWGGSTVSDPIDFDPGGVAYDPATATWRILDPAPFGLIAPRAIALDEGVLFAGGIPKHVTDAPTSLWLDLTDGRWTELHAPIAAMTLTTVEGDVLAVGPVNLVGGSAGTGDWQVARFDPHQLAWEPVGEPLTAEWMTLVADSDGIQVVAREGLNEPLRAYKQDAQQWIEVAHTNRGTDSIVTIEIIGYPPTAVSTDTQLIIGGMQGLVAYDPEQQAFSTMSDPRIQSFGTTPIWTGEHIVSLTGQSTDGWVFTPDSTDH